MPTEVYEHPPAGYLRISFSETLFPQVPMLTDGILEAKYLFTVGPDRRELHCIILDQHAINVGRQACVHVPRHVAGRRLWARFGTDSPKKPRDSPSSYVRGGPGRGHYHSYSLQLSSRGDPRRPVPFSLDAIQRFIGDAFLRTPGIHEHARKQLCQLIRQFLPVLPEEAIVLLRVFRPTQED
ncbi:hypothetical protein RB195_016383 [Necator americanus]